MIRVAIVGAGAISSFHIEGYLAFPDRCRIVAIADIDTERARRRIEEYGLDAAAVASIDDLPRVDLASVCTPPGTHAPLTIALLNDGVHVLCEKPMAASVAECDAMVEAASAGGAILSVVAQNRFTEPMAKLKQVLDSGLAGRMLHVRADSHWWRGTNYYDLWWRGTWQSEGGGPTLNHAVHHIDALRWMAGPPSQVQAIMANLAHDNAEVEDLSLTVLRFPSGALGEVVASVVHHGQDQRIVFQCERASVAMPWAVSASRQRADGFPVPDTETETEIAAFADALPAPRYEGHPGQIDDVLTAIESGTGDVLVDGDQGRGTVELITGIYESAITGAAVGLPLAADDRFRTREGLVAAAPRFHEKRASVREFAAEERISTTGGQA
jgi:UDP-N-acetyl-2-amino-2-deoxyglucuronate dehydrogenase